MRYLRVFALKVQSLVSNDQPSTHGSHAMSKQAELEYARNVLKKVGWWSGLRFLRRQGVPFETAHLAHTGKAPRR